VAGGQDFLEPMLAHSRLFLRNKVFYLANEFIATLLFLLRKKAKKNKNHFNLKIGKAFTKTQILTNSVEIVKKPFL
jgi:hypothetical protein